jgi:hypothetical protein
MAWVTVPGSNSIWQYENSATATHTYPDAAAGANSVISGGIRTYTKPGTSNTVQTYIRTRKTGHKRVVSYQKLITMLNKKL